LISQGSVSRGYLGIRFGPVSETLAKALDAPRGSAQVASVESGTAADRAGLKEGDVIVGLNGKELSNANELLSTIATSLPGDVVEIEYIRDGRRKTIDVELGVRPDAEALAESQTEQGEGERDAFSAMKESLGLTMRTLTTELAQRYSIDEDVSGVLLTDVAESSEAYRDADIRARDVIVEVDRRSVSNVEEFMEAYEDIESGKAFLVRIHRSGTTFLTALTKPE
jgi:serine protease Do